MDGKSALSEDPILNGVSDLGSYIGGAADYDHDGIADILFVDRTTGEMSVLLMHGDPDQRLEIYLDRLPSMNWKVRSIGDFFGDGTIAMALHNSVDGQVAIQSGYSMQNFAALSLQVITDAGSLSPSNWRIGGSLEP